MAIPQYDDSSIVYDQSDRTYDGNSIIAKILTETLSVSDSLIKSITRILTGNVAIGDSSLLAKSIIRSLSETVFSSEVFARVASYKRTLSEAITTTDSVLRYINGELVIWANKVKSAASSFTNKAKNSSIWTNKNKP